jgi:hypothetical protein
MNDATKEMVSAKIEQTIEAAEEIVRHPYIKKLAQLGFYTKGFLFIVIGVLAILVAAGEKEGQLIDTTGALTRIAQETYGKVILIVFIIGALGHGVWNILRGVADVDNSGKNLQGISKRVLAVGVGMFYLFLAWTAWDIVFTVQVSVQNGTLQKTFTAILLALPFGVGAIFVGIIGLGVIGAGINECYSGITGKYQENFKLYKLEGNGQRVISTLGFVSFLARALIFALMGYFFIAAAVNGNPDEAVGIDGALQTLAQSYFGKTLLFITAAGLVCHGILSLYEAKYRRIC